MPTIPSSINTYKIHKKILLYFFLIIWCFAILTVIQKNSISNSLRHGQVAVGDISRQASAIFNGGLAGYKNVLKGDAVQWGRVRPIHWLYYGLPFFVSMARNGDIVWVDKEVPISERFNGDLQTHVLFLIVTLSIALSAMIYTSVSLGSNLWIMLMLPIFIGTSQTLSGNLILYQADSQEIPQILFISLYLWSISKIIKGSLLSKKREVISIIFLLLAYGTKETSIVLLPVISLLFILSYRKNKNDRNKVLFMFYMRQIGYNSIFVIILLIFIYQYKSGAYVSNHFNLKDIYSSQTGYSQIGYSLKALKSGLPVLYLMAIAIITGFFLGIYKISKEELKKIESETWAITSILLFLGFWLIMLPWHVRMAKYYLPAFVFASYSCTQLLSLNQKYLWENRYFLAATIWIIGIVFYIGSDINLKLENVNRFYLRHYEAREAIPIITKDISDHVSGTDSSETIALISRYFNEGPLPFVRQLNKQYRLNISIEGEIVKRIPAREKNYLRHYKNERNVEFKHYNKYNDSINADIIYIITEKAGKKKQQSDISYLLTNQWKTSHKTYNIFKYVKER